jgi:hypothetical protein
MAIERNDSSGHLSNSSGNMSLGEMSDGAASFSGSDVDINIDLGMDNLLDAVKVAQSMRLVEYNVDVLCGFLEKVTANRDAGARPLLPRVNSVAQLIEDDETRILGGRKATVFDEALETITMPKFDPKVAKRLVLKKEAKHVTPLVKDQLRDYVMRVSSMYRDNPFHNFEHASQVVMTAAAFVNRIIDPEIVDTDEKDSVHAAKELHQRTFGISSDPLSQFTIVLVSLILDIDHPGLPNSKLVSLMTPSAIMYKNKSVSQQNSIDVAWTVLMDDDFRGTLHHAPNSAISLLAHVSFESLILLSPF